MIPPWLELRLACPDCRSPLRRVPEGPFRCSGCGGEFPMRNGIPHLWPAAAQPPSAEGDPFGAVAAIYDETIPAHVREHYLRKRVGLLQRFAQRGTLLDVGCGTGALAWRLAADFEAVGVDASSAMLQVMRQRCALPAVCAQSRRLPFLDGSFDTVLCVAMLHHVAEKEAVAETIREMIRVARRGGTIVLVDHNPLNPYWPWLMRRMPQDDGTERLVPLGEILENVRGAQAEPVGVYRLGFVPDFTPPGLLALARGLERLLEALPLVRQVAAHNIIVARKP